MAEIAYMPLARRFRIGQPVGPRSSHGSYTLTGGGIIFPVAMLAFAVFFRHELTPDIILMLGGMTVLAVVSMIDDIHEISPTVRLIVQIAVVAAVYARWATPSTAAVYLLLLILGVGFLNAFNFIDGINGIMSAYALVTLGAIAYAYSLIPLPPGSLLYQIVIFTAIAAAVFAFFNLRRKALVFAGDVGSMSLGFVILFLMWQLIALTGDASCLVLLIVCAVETVLTTLGRLFEGANILLPHRRFLFQLLVNEDHRSHCAVALSYTGLQLAIDIGYFLIPPFMQWPYAIIVTVLLVAAYFIIKKRVDKGRRKPRKS